MHIALSAPITYPTSWPSYPTDQRNNTPPHKHLSIRLSTSSLGWL